MTLISFPTIIVKCFFFVFFWRNKISHILAGHQNNLGNSAFWLAEIHHSRNETSDVYLHTPIQINITFIFYIWPKILIGSFQNDTRWMVIFILGSNVIPRLALRSGPPRWRSRFATLPPSWTDISILISNHYFFAS